MCYEDHPSPDLTGMTSQTPLNLMVHRGPLSTPSTSSLSDRSSPCSSWSSSPSDTSSSTFCSPPVKSMIDILRPGSPPMRTLSMRRNPQSLRRYSYHRDEKPMALPKSSFRRFKHEFEDLVYQVSELAKTVVVAFMFYMMFLRLFELASCTPQLSRPPTSSWISKSYLPLPSTTRSLRCQLNLSPCEPREPQAAMLQFLSEQIQHAKALSSLNANLSLPLRTLHETHHAHSPMLIARRHLSKLPYLMQEIDILKNLTEMLDSPLLDFTPSSFIGKSFSLALDELDDLVSDPAFLYDSSTYKELQEAHSHAIYWRTASNLLLEYSAARLRARSLLQEIRAVHQSLSALLSSQVDASPHRLCRKYTRDPTASTEKSLRVYLATLAATMENVRCLSTSLDRIAEQLAQTTLENILQPGRRTDFSSTLASLQELFAQSRHPPIKKRLHMEIASLRYQLIL